MIQRKILKNGMTVVFKQRRNRVVSVAFAVRFGAMNETASNKGIAHFIEHMLYKGTPTRNAAQIATEIEKNGGELNGFTSEQVTAFWCKMPSKHIYVALDVLSDMVKNPLFDNNEVEKERNVIFEEMKMYHDSPTLYIFNEIKSLMYKGDFAIPIIGTKKSMLDNSPDKLRKVFDKVYSPKNMILCVIGDADFEKICSFAESNFGDNKEKVFYPKIQLNSGGIKIEKRKGVDQANLIFAYHIPLPHDDKNYAAHVLNVLMAGGMSSRLFSEIREKRNLAYAVKGINEEEKDYAYNAIYVGTTLENVHKVRELILDEFKKVSKSLTEKELEEVKEQIIGNYMLLQEDSYNILLELLLNEIKGNASTSDEFVNKIRSVRLEDVKKLANIKYYGFFALIPE